MFYNKRKKRGRVVLLTCILLIFAGLTYGYVSNNEPQVKPNPNNIRKLPEKGKINNEPVKKPNDEDLEQLGMNSEAAQNGVEEAVDTIAKVDEESNIILRTYYTKTGEIDTKKIGIPITIVGASLNEFKSYIESNYSDWVIREVSTKSASLFKQVDGYKPDNFIIQNKDGYIVIYKINQSGEKEIYEKTNISLSTLSETDKRKLEAGITVKTLDDVYNIIEDYSS